MICGLSYKLAMEAQGQSATGASACLATFPEIGIGVSWSTPNSDSSRMRDHHQRPRPPEHAIQGLPQALGIEGGEALVEHDELGALEQGAGDVEAALLAVRELPAGLSHHLLQTGGAAGPHGAPAQAPAGPPP